MTAAFTFERQGRNRRTALVVLAIWTALVLAWVFWEMAWWIVLFLAAFTLPALWDHYANPLSGLTLSPAEITWFSGKRSGAVALEEIDHVRLDTRLDFSVRATLVLRTGAKVRLPFEATPPDKELEDALKAVNIPVKRFHFQLFQ